jgi:hypothetical protein
MGLAGNKIRAASIAVPADETNPSSEAAPSIPECPIASRTNVAGVSVRWRRLSFSGSTREREAVASTWSR